MNETIQALAATQSGVFTRNQALARGVQVKELDQWRRQGRILALRRGEYVVSDVWLKANREEQYALKVRAILLETDYVATHHAAAALFGLPLFGVDFKIVDAFAKVTKLRTSAGIRRRPMTNEVKVQNLGAAFAVPIEMCIAQVGAVSLESGLVMLDYALSNHLVTIDGVEESAVKNGLCQRRTRNMLKFADALAESVGETRSRLLFIRLGYSPQSQVQIFDAQGLIGRVDFLIDHVVVEFDGMMKYADADGRAALAAEKAREDRLRAAGYGIVRLTWSDLDEPQRVADLIDRQEQVVTRHPRLGVPA